MVQAEAMQQQKDTSERHCRALERLAEVIDRKKLS